MWEHAGWAMVIMVSFWAATQVQGADVPLVRRYHQASTIGPKGYTEPEPPVTAPAGLKSYAGTARFDFTPDLPRLEHLTPEALRALHATFCRKRTPLADAGKKMDGRSITLARLSTGVLGRVLFGGMGLTKVERTAGASFAYRSAPSAGALYPIELYVAPAEVEGLPRGLYHYDVQHNQLEQVRAGDAAAQVEGALTPAERGRGAAGYVVLTGVFARTRAKYNVRAYRYVLLDAGQVAGNLSLTAAGDGLGVRLLADFDDDALNQALALDGEQEASLLVIALDTSPAAGPSPSTPAAAIPVPGRPEASALSLRAHQATRLGPAEVAPPGQGELPAEMPSEGVKLMALPLPEEPRLGLEEALVARRSRRSFGRRALSTAELSALLAWPGSAAPLPGLRWYLVVNRVEGVPPGVYRYWPRERALELKTPAVRSRELAAAALGQGWVAEAPCVVVAVAEADSLDGPRGARWYRKVHLAAGEAGGWLYLSAEGLNLSTCAVGAFADGALAQVLGLEGGLRPGSARAPDGRAWPLILYPVGSR